MKTSKTSITSVLVVRDNDGFWLHPNVPDFGEEVSSETWRQWYSDHQLEVTGHYMVDDSDELAERYYEEDYLAIHEWHPEPPEGFGWFLWAIFDTEDGPYCQFVRNTPESADK